MVRTRSPFRGRAIPDKLRRPQPPKKAWWQGIWMYAAVAVALLAVWYGRGGLDGTADDGVGAWDLDTGGAPLVQQLELDVPDEHVDAAETALRTAARTLRVFDEWVFEPLPTVGDARRYLQHHPRMGKHATAFSKAAFEATPLSDEELGYTYLVCAAGGPLVFDFFGSHINVSQYINPARNMLTRQFTYQRSIHSMPDADVMERCGPLVEMQAPAPDLPLPYSDCFESTVQISETWRTETPLPPSADEGTRVGIHPYDQWSIDHLSFSVSLKAKRHFTHWLDKYGSEELEYVLGEERWSNLTRVEALHGERLVGDVTGHCNLRDPKEELRCLHPLTMQVGENPLVSSSIFLEWQELKWLDGAEDPSAHYDEEPLDGLVMASH